jgi:urea transport system substrate-binding protein
MEGRLAKTVGRPDSKRGGGMNRNCGHRPGILIVSLSVVALLVAAVVLVVAGCGSTTSTTQPTASTSSSSGATSASGTIKIGFDGDLSGSIAADGQALLAATKLFAQETNAKGGLLGKQVEVITEDGASDPKTGNEKAKALLGQNVDVVIGPILSAERNAVQPTVTNAGKILLYSTFYEGGAYNDLMFVDGEVPEQQTAAFVPWLVKNYGPKFYFLGSDYVYPHGTNAKAKEYLKAAGGSVVGEEYVALGTTDFSSVLTRIAKAKPDVLFVDVVGTDGIALSKQFYDYGLSKSTHFASTVHMESYITAIGPQASEGTTVSFGYFQNLKTPANDAFLAGFRKIEPKLPATTITARGYVLLQMWAAAVTKAGTTDSQAVKTAFEGISLADSPIGPVTMRASDHHTQGHMYIAVVKNGQFEVVQDLGMVDPGTDQKAASQQ